MATILSFLSGRQITNANGVPQSGALLYHYQAGTTTNLTVYSNQAGTTPHAQPVVCDAGGFVPLIYIGDTSDWKVVIQTALAVTLQTYDNLPAAEVETSTSSFASPLITWNQVTSASSPVALTAALAGNAYEADTTSGNIEFDLPSAASVGNGKGFIFKKTASANSMVIDPSGSETIDDVSTSRTITQQYQTIGVYSNGAEWYTVISFLLDEVPDPTVQRFTSGTAQTYTPATGVDYIRVRMVGGGGGGGAALTNNGASGTTTTFGSWTAIFGQGGVVAGQGGAGGTGGANGTGTLIARFDGQNGVSLIGAGESGHGGSTPFGGAGSGETGAAGETAKANTGSGGGGGASGGAGAGGGGAGEYVEFFVFDPANHTYTVGASGAGGAAGTQAGGAGAAGVIIIEEYYKTGAF